MAQAKRKAKAHLMMLDGKWYKMTPLSKSELKKAKSEGGKTIWFEDPTGNGWY